MAQKPNRGDLKLFNRDTFPISTFLILFFICLVLMGSDFRYQILKKIRLEIPIIIAPINNLINLFLVVKELCCMLFLRTKLL